MKRTLLLATSLSAITVVVLINHVRGSTYNASDLPELPVIEDLDDIEALAYFVLARKSRLSFRHEKSAENSVVNETIIDERQFQDFLLKLKEGSVFSDKPVDEIPPCDQLQQEYMEILRARKVTPGPRFEEKLPFMCQATTKCQSAQSFVSLISGVHTSSQYEPHEPHLTLNQAIVRLCPVMLSQIHDKACTATDENKLVKHKPSSSAVWGFGFLFVTIISFCSIIGVALMPFLDQKSFAIVLNVCQGLGRLSSR